MSSYQISGRQLRAARALAGLTQQQLADTAFLHVNSVRYIERQEREIKPGHSVSCMMQALREFGVELTFDPSPGVRMTASHEHCS